MAAFAKDLIMQKVSSPHRCSERKVSIVGTGNVGMACAFAILNRRIANEVCLIDSVNPGLMGEVEDLQQATCFLENTKISGSPNYSISSGSRIVVITAGARQMVGETRLDLLKRNIEIMKDIVPKIMAHNQDPILLVLSNPCEIMTYIAWKMSGLPKHRVIGTGTTLDTARFSYFISEHLGVAPSECKGWILGEHGDSSVAVWSSVVVGGIKLRDVYPDMGTANDKTDWKGIHKKVIDAAYGIIQLKGYTNWAIGIICASLVEDIFRDTGSIRAISTCAQGHFGIDKSVFLSLPCVVGATGITNVLRLPLESDELANLKESAETLYKSMCNFKVVSKASNLEKK